MAIPFKHHNLIGLLERPESYGKSVYEDKNFTFVLEDRGWVVKVYWKTPMWTSDEARALGFKVAGKDDIISNYRQKQWDNFENPSWDFGEAEAKGFGKDYYTTRVLVYEGKGFVTSIRKDIWKPLFRKSVHALRVQLKNENIERQNEWQTSADKADGTSHKPIEAVKNLNPYELLADFLGGIWEVIAAPIGYSLCALLLVLSLGFVFMICCTTDPTLPDQGIVQTEIVKTQSQESSENNVSGGFVGAGIGLLLLGPVGALIGAGIGVAVN